MSQDEKAFTWETPPELWRGVKFASPSWQGKVVSLYIAPEPSKPMVALSEVRAFATAFFGNLGKRPTGLTRR